MALDMFLVLKSKSGLPAFKAETTDVTFSRYISIPVVHFALGYSDPVTISAGAGIGKLTFQNLNLILNAGVNAPGFLTMAGMGQSFDSMTLYVRNVVGTAPHVTSIYHFGGVFITGVSQDANNGDSATAMNLSLAFGQLSHHGSSTSATGVVTPGIIGSWNILTNTSWSEPALDGPGWV